MLLAQDRLVEWDEQDEAACEEASRQNQADYERWLRGTRLGAEPQPRGPVFKTRRGRLIAISYSAPSSDRIKAGFGALGFGALVIAEDDGAFIEMAPTRLRHVSSVPVTPKPAPTSIPGPGVPRG